MEFKLVRPNKAWAKVMWQLGEPLPSDVEFVFKQAAQLPGVKLGPMTLELPITTWALPSIRHLWEDLGGSNLWTEFPRALTWETVARVPYEHQLHAAERILTKAGFLLCDDMGLGKSGSAILAAEQIRRDHGGPGVIVAPLFTRNVWIDELTAAGAIKHPHELYICKGGPIATDLKGLTVGYSWYFCHYDMVLEWWQKLYSQKPCVAILDEAHWVKNAKSKRAQGALMVAGTSPRRILLTGTPLENQPIDLYNLLTMATGPWTWGSYSDFAKRYCGAEYNGFGYTNGDPTNTDELKARMDPFYLRRTIKDIGHQLPEFTRKVHLCEMASSHQKSHDKLMSKAHREQLVKAILRGSLTDDMLSVLNKLRQVTSKAKVPDTLQLLENLKQQGEHAVVFVWERETAHLIADHFDADAVPVTGEMDQDTRGEYCKGFQDGAFNFIVATYGALREGVTLHRARHVILHDLDQVYTHIQQAEKRVHRIGQKFAVQSTWMVAKNSIDSILAPLLIEKSKALHEVLGDDQKLMEDMNLEEVLGVETFEQRVAKVMQMWSEI